MSSKLKPLSISLLTIALCIGLAVIGAQIACKGDCQPCPDPSPCPSDTPTPTPTAPPVFQSDPFECPPDIASVNWCSSNSDVNCILKLGDGECVYLYTENQ